MYQMNSTLSMYAVEDGEILHLFFGVSLTSVIVNSYSHEYMYVAGTSFIESVVILANLCKLMLTSSYLVALTHLLNTSN